MKEILAASLIAPLYSLWSRSFRYRLYFARAEDVPKFFSSLINPDSKGTLFSAFHQTEMALLPFFRDLKISIMISPSKDGEILATVANYFGYGTIRGSSNKRPVASVLEAIRFIKNERGKLCLAVDGPRGPAFKCKPGLTKISQKTDIPIIPAFCRTHWGHTFEGAWSKSRIPYFGTRIDVLVGHIEMHGWVYVPVLCLARHLSSQVSVIFNSIRLYIVQSDTTKDVYAPLKNCSLVSLSFRQYHECRRRIGQRPYCGHQA